MGSKVDSSLSWWQVLKHCDYQQHSGTRQVSGGYSPASHPCSFPDQQMRDLWCIKCHRNIFLSAPFLPSIIPPTSKLRDHEHSSLSVSYRRPVWTSREVSDWLVKHRQLSGERVDDQVVCEREQERFCRHPNFLIEPKVSARQFTKYRFSCSQAANWPAFILLSIVLSTGVVHMRLRQKQRNIIPQCAPWLLARSQPHGACAWDGKL
jgi:hypothetical protein